ncbi:recombinase family protein [Pseudomonas sp. 165]|uniref:recombinase family protein n=1 Tax=Pseudomonas sp. 165 TaxID=2746722 RepID=UPI002575E8A1|nr:recombinase family protein [Pseudomonas sp. 165]MDM1709592.1 recombinase family protein [Pseudomonas sp. 165]
MPNQRTKAYSYIRFSTPEQAKGDSYRRQRAAAEMYCLQNDFELVKDEDYLFFDRGRSAYKGKHLDDTGQLSRFLKYVQDGTIDPGSILIIESLDRLSREHVRAALPRFLDILGSGIQIYSVSDNRLYQKDWDEKDLILGIFQMSRAHSESSLKGERVGKAWSRKQDDARDTKKPLGRACPYWLKLEKDQHGNDKYVEVAERVETIKKIFALAIAGHGHRAIAKILNAENIPIFGSAKRNVSGAWGSSSTGKILSNRAVLGEYQPTGLNDGVRGPRGEPVLDFYPSVISEDLFLQVQAARTTRNVSKATKSSANFNVWQGLAKCALCGDAMHLVNKGRPPKGGKYLRCYSSAKGRCTNKLVPLAASELVYMEILAKVNSLSLVQDSQARIQKEIASIDIRLDLIKKRQAQISSQLLDVNGDLPAFVLETAMRIDQDLKELKSKKSELKRDAQREKILDKKDFFEKLDLVSFEGRAKANYLLKVLKVKVLIGRENEAVNYIVEAEDVRTLVMRQVADQIDYYPYTAELTELLRSHGDDAAFNKMHAEMVARSLALVEQVQDYSKVETILAKRGRPIRL